MCSTYDAVLKDFQSNLINFVNVSYPAVYHEITANFNMPELSMAFSV